MHERTWHSRRDRSSGASLITLGHSNPARFQAWKNLTVHLMILENIAHHCSLVPLSVDGVHSKGPSYSSLAFSLLSRVAVSHLLSIPPTPLSLLEDSPSFCFKGTVHNLLPPNLHFICKYPPLFYCLTTNLRLNLSPPHIPCGCSGIRFPGILSFPYLPHHHLADLSQRVQVSLTTGKALPQPHLLFQLNSSPHFYLPKPNWSCLPPFTTNLPPPTHSLNHWTYHFNETAFGTATN